GWIVVPLAVAAACSASNAASPGASDSGTDASTSGGDDATGGDSGSVPQPVAIAADPQRPGDPQKGYDALVNQGYVGCGVPYTAYAQVFGTPAQNELLSGRNAANANIPYDLTRFTTDDGVDVVGPNCLACHAAMLGGQVVIGLGNTTNDFTTN